MPRRLFVKYLWNLIAWNFLIWCCIYSVISIIENLVMIKKNEISSSSEDYLEAIYLICREQGEARSKEIMQRLAVSGSSVTEALQVLARKGLVNYSPYEAITLTAKGEKIAKDVLHRHEALRNFFVEILGIDAKLADEGACKMEHVASREVVERLVKYTSYLQECKTKGCDKRFCFAEYLEKNQ